MIYRCETCQVDYEGKPGCDHFGDTEVEQLRKERDRLRDAVEYAHSQGFQWPSDPMPPKTPCTTCAGTGYVTDIGLNQACSDCGGVGSDEPL